MLKFQMQKKWRRATTLLLFAGLLLSFANTLSAKPFPGKTKQLPPQKIEAGNSEILIDFTLPENHEFALEAPSTIWVRIKDALVLKLNTPQSKPQKLDLSKLPHFIAVAAEPGKTVVAIDVRAHFCDKKTQICLTESVRVKFPLLVSPEAPSSFKINIPLCHKAAACPEPTSSTK